MPLSCKYKHIVDICQIIQLTGSSCTSPKSLHKPCMPAGTRNTTKISSSRWKDICASSCTWGTDFAVIALLYSVQTCSSQKTSYILGKISPSCTSKYNQRSQTGHTSSVSCHVTHASCFPHKHTLFLRRVWSEPCKLGKIIKLAAGLVTSELSIVWVKSLQPKVFLGHAGLPALSVVLQHKSGSRLPNKTGELLTDMLDLKYRTGGSSGSQELAKKFRSLKVFDSLVEVYIQLATSRYSDDAKSLNCKYSWSHILVIVNMQLYAIFHFMLR